MARTATIDKAITRAKNASALFTRAAAELEASSRALEAEADSRREHVSILLAEIDLAERERVRNDELVAKLREFER